MSCRALVHGFRAVLFASVLFGLSVGAAAEVGEWTSNGPEGAVVKVLDFSPLAPETIYAATGGLHGVWKSTDGGATWSAAGEGIETNDLRAMAVDQQQPQTVYCGTYQAGIFKTTDGGRSWIDVTAGLKPNVGALAVDPTASTVYVGLYGGGVHRSTDGGASWASLNNGIDDRLTVIEIVIDPSAPQTIYLGSYDGLFKTTDGGASWEDLSGQLPDHAVQSVALDPTDTSTVYVGLEGGGVHKSTDGGASFLDTNSGITNLYIEVVTVDSSTPTTLYAGGRGVFKSMDAGATWVVMDNGMPALAVYDLDLGASDSSTVLASTNAGVFMSTDGATSWAASSTGLLGSWTSVLVADSGAPGSVRTGTTNGVWTSTDFAFSWQSATGDLGVLGVAALARDPGDVDVMFAGTWGGLYKTTDGGSTWVRRDEGLTEINVGMVATDPMIADRIYVGVWDGLHISSDGGETWSQPETGPQEQRVVSIAFDPAQPTTLYAGAADGVYRSDDSGETWTSSVDGNYCWAVAVDPNATSTVYKCTYSGVHKSTDGGGTWTESSEGLTESNCWALAVDPMLPDTIYMGSGRGVFVSTDGAATWERFPGVDDYNVFDLVFDAAGHTLYAALRGGGVAAYTFDAGGECTLQCSASVPASAMMGAGVPFEGAAAATGCSGTPSYQWDFGDGSEGSSDQSPMHRYAAADSFTWTMTASADDATCSANGEIAVESFAPTWFVPAAAHVPGVGGTAWRTDVTAVAWDLGAANLELRFVPYGGGAGSDQQYTLASGETLEWQDILVSLFGFADGAAVKGTVQVSTDAPVFITSRTYNQTQSGTYGQQIPALAASAAAKGIVTGEVGVIPQLKKNAAFRSNVGAQNLGDSDVEVQITLHDWQGRQMGSQITATIGVGQYWQQNDIFAATGAGDADLAYALVEVLSANGSAWFYGSVVDNATGDPTTVPALLPGDGQAVIGGVAHAPGAEGTVWRTDMALVNPGAAQAELDFEFVAYEGGPLTTAGALLVGGQSYEGIDVLVSYFSVDPESPIKGTIRIADLNGVCITARTYNQAADGTFGQLMPAVRTSEGFASGQIVVIPALKSNDAFRSNVGALNLSDVTVDFTVTLHDSVGDQIGSPVTRSVSALEYYQIDNVFNAAGAGDCDLGYAVLDVETVGARVWAYASVVDNLTGDPTTVPALGY